MRPTKLPFLLALIVAATAACATRTAPVGAVPGLDLANRPAVEGITRTTLRDDAQATVTRVHFAPGAAEPVHTHPYPILIVPIRAGAVTWVVDGQSTTYLEVGAVQHVAGGVPHQLANTGTEPFEIIAVALK